MKCMQDNTKWYWEKSIQQNNINHAWMSPLSQKKKIPETVCNKNQACKAMHRSPILIIDSDRFYT